MAGRLTARTASYSTDRIKRNPSHSVDRIKRNASHSIDRIKRNVNVSYSIELQDESDDESDQEFIPETKSTNNITDTDNKDNKHIDHNKNTENNNNTTNSTINNSKLYMISYLLMYVVLGFLDSSDASIYVDIQHDLNTSTFMMSWIYAAGAFAMIPASIISGYITDKYIETHRYASFVLCLNTISLFLIPYTNNIIIMFIHFILIGIAYAAVDTCSAVWIFRLYPINGGQMYFFYDTIRDVIGTITPLIFELSISYSGKYSFPLFIFSFMSFIVTIVILFLPTPKHDKLRSIKREFVEKIKSKSLTADNTIELTAEINPLKGNNKLFVIDEKKLEEISANAKKKLKQDPKYKQLQYSMIGIFIIIMFFYGAFSEVMGVFITTYCVDYLGIDESIGRYLLAVFMGANVLYRIVALFIENICGYELNNLYIIFVANIIQLIAVGILFIFYGDIIYVLFVVYAICGFFGSPTYPGICDCIEEVRPVTGFITCMIMVAFIAGDAIFTLIMGMLIQTFGAGIFPVALTVPLMAMGILTCINLLLHRSYEKIKSKTISYQNVATM